MNDDSEPNSIALSDSNSLEFGTRVSKNHGEFAKQFRATFAKWAKKRGLPGDTGLTYSKKRPHHTRTKP